MNVIVQMSEIQCSNTLNDSDKLLCCSQVMVTSVYMLLQSSDESERIVSIQGVSRENGWLVQMLARNLTEHI